MVKIKTPCDKVNSKFIEDYPIPCYDCMIEHNPEVTDELVAARAGAVEKIEQYKLSNEHKFDLELIAARRAAKAEENDGS